MAQYDVCRSQRRANNDTLYYVIVQSNLYRNSDRLLVLPLNRRKGHPYPSVAPIFKIEGVEVIADALLMFPIPVSALGPVIQSLADDTSVSAIRNAIDAVLTNAYP